MIIFSSFLFVYIVAAYQKSLTFVQVTKTHIGCAASKHLTWTSSLNENANVGT